MTRIGMEKRSNVVYVEQDGFAQIINSCVVLLKVF